MNARQAKTLEKILEKPTRADVTWTEAESLFTALGAKFRHGRGSVVLIALAGRVASVHKPHPGNELKKWAVEALRVLLEQVGHRSDA